MPNIPDPSLTTGPQQHLADHQQLHNLHNALVQGPFTLTHDTPGIDTGVTLWTPAFGDRIIGLTVEFTQLWSTPGEKFGLGIAGTADDDLGFVFDTATVLPDHPTWARGEGFGFMWGAAVIRLLSAEPILARTVVGGNGTGGLHMWVHTLPASAY